MPGPGAGVEPQLASELLLLLLLSLDLPRAADSACALSGWLSFPGPQCPHWQGEEQGDHTDRFVRSVQLRRPRIARFPEPFVLAPGWASPRQGPATPCFGRGVCACVLTQTHAHTPGRRCFAPILAATLSAP